MIRLTDAIDSEQRIQLLEIEDVARMFRTDEETVHRWISEGDLEHSVVNGQGCFSDHDLCEFVLTKNLDPFKIIKNLGRDEKDRLPTVPYEDDPLAAFKLDPGNALGCIDEVDGTGAYIEVLFGEDGRRSKDLDDADFVDDDDDADR